MAALSNPAQLHADDVTRVARTTSIINDPPLPLSPHASNEERGCKQDGAYLAAAHVCFHVGWAQGNGRVTIRDGIRIWGRQQSVKRSVPSRLRYSCLFRAAEGPPRGCSERRRAAPQMEPVCAGARALVEFRFGLRRTLRRPPVHHRQPDLCRPLQERLVPSTRPLPWKRAAAYSSHRQACDPH
jgi:hypothetical protein